MFPVNPQLGDVNIRLSPALEARLGAAIDSIASSVSLGAWAVVALAAVAAIALWRRS
jgi:hypothetical protein